MVGLGGLEPPTSRLSGVRSNHLSYKPIFYCQYGGDEETRTPDLLHAKQTLSQLSHAPAIAFYDKMVEMRRIELLTPCLQGRCSPN